MNCRVERRRMAGSNDDGTTVSSWRSIFGAWAGAGAAGGIAHKHLLVGSYARLLESGAPAILSTKDDGWPVGSQQCP